MTSKNQKNFIDATEAVTKLQCLYNQSISNLQKAFKSTMSGHRPDDKIQEYYPQITIKIDSFSEVDSRLAFGHVNNPGTYTTTITRPNLFKKYLIQQISLLIKNHNVPIQVNYSDTPIPIHFAMKEEIITDLKFGNFDFPLRDYFDVPNLSNTNDNIVNGTLKSSKIKPLAPFTAQRIDYSLARISHYTATEPEHFQNHVLFTNYQFYVDEFISYSHSVIADKKSGYHELIGPNNQILSNKNISTSDSKNLPQMPTYHLKQKDGSGITLVNIGVGPSNAKTATDHIAVLRPHAWIMLGHCAGLRASQRLGDYVLAHAYVREDHVLDDDIPVWVPLPALAEVQIAMENAVASVTKLSGFELKNIMRTGTVATIDNRNWELKDQSGPVTRLSQSRAIALDMESATIAANGFRFRVPYGTLLCISDKPLHGELKLPGMATEFYNTQVKQHLNIGIKAMESLRNMPLERLHSRKLRSFEETAFL
ncbi:MAG: AMP nucleosidase [Rhodobacteraceae bacterium]|jgi:AMP nucleosidase|nr:AMP nucleosidase [Paracoccaceae bacterium]